MKVSESSQNVLLIAPLAEDDVLGVGGTMAWYANMGYKVNVCIVTKGAEPLYRANRLHIIQNETRQAHELLGVQETFLRNFPAVMLETIPRYTPCYNSFYSQCLDLFFRISPDKDCCDAMF